MVLRLPQLIPVLFFVSIQASSQDQEWVKFTKSNDDTWITASAVDTGNNVIVAAWSRNKYLKFGGSTFTGTGEGCMAKLKPDGTLLWLKEIPGMARDLKIGKDNSIYISGGFSYSGKLDGKIYSTVSRYDDLYIAKLNSNGTLVWIHQSSGEQGERGLHLELDSKDNVFLVAEYGHREQFKKAAFCGYDLPPPTHSQSHAFIAKFDKAGKNQFVIPFSSWGHEPPFAIDQEDNLYATSWLARGLITTYDTVYKKENLTGLIVKFNADLKVNGFFEVPWNGVRSVHCDEQNNLVVTGACKTPIRAFSQVMPYKTVGGLMVLKYSQSGGPAWAYYGDGPGGFPGAEGLAIATNAFGDVFVSGWFGRSTVFKDSTGKEVGSAGFVLKCDEDGNLEWIKTVDSPVFVMMNELTTDRNGNVFVSGLYSESCLFENGLQTASAQKQDSFIIKYQDSDTSHKANNDALICRSVYFEKDSFTLSEYEKLLLLNIRFFLETNTNYSIECKGHTDKDGSDENYQQTLSEARAASVQNYLISCGIDSTRISTVGIGASANINLNLTDLERQGNRRVEIIIR